MSKRLCECGQKKDWLANRCRSCAHAAGDYHFWTREDCIAAIREWVDAHGHVPSADSRSPWYDEPWSRPTRRAIERIFGSWNKAIIAAGFEPNRRGPKVHWTKDTVANAMLDFLFREGRWPYITEWRLARTDDEAYRPNASTVTDLFGSWTAAKRYAGWIPDREKNSAGPAYADWCCSGCGTDDPATRTRGCTPCKWRAQKRNRRVPAASRSGLGGLSTGRDSSSSPRGGTNGGGTPLHKQTARRNRQVTTARSDERSVAA